jgi:hypothetical protein
VLLTPKITNFYKNGFEETEVHKDWPRLWNKHYRIQLWKGQFLKLNRFRGRLNFKSLKWLCTKYRPIHVYMSVMNWIFPERVGLKRKARHAYPIGGEYVVDLDTGSARAFLSNFHNNSYHNSNN